MLNLGGDCRIWLYTPACDMRRSFGGLSALVRTELGADPTNRTQRTVYVYRQILRVNLSDWVNRPLRAISRRDVEARFHRITDKHGWAGANQTMSMLRSIYRRPCVDHEGLRNLVELWLAVSSDAQKKDFRAV